MRELTMTLGEFLSSKWEETAKGGLGKYVYIEDDESRKVLMNLWTGQWLRAREKHIEELINNAWQEGWNKGYAKALQEQGV